MKKLFPKINLKKILETHWPILIILVVSLFLLRSFIKPGFPETHDGQLYMARFSNFHLAFTDRHFPMRWAPNLNYKFGYPIFTFNYFTPYALGLIPKVLLKTSFETSLKLVIFFSFFVGGLFWYLFFKKKISKSAFTLRQPIPGRRIVITDALIPGRFKYMIRFFI